MAETVTMPKLGFDMAEGTLVRWVKAVGEAVKKGEVLAEIETDKATVEVESNFTGVVYQQLVEQGTVVPVGTAIAIITAPGEAAPVLKAAEPEKELPPQPAPMPEPQPPEAALEPKKANEVVSGDRVKASPLAKRVAKELGVDLQVIQGSGPNGRIVRKDVELAKTEPTVPHAVETRFETPAPVFTPNPTAADEHAAMGKLRAAIGRRMLDSWQTIPTFFVTAEYNSAPLAKLRSEVNALLSQEEKVSVNDFIIKAAALALRQFPNLNASLINGEVIRHGHIHIGVAVAVDGGLLTVVVKDADQKPLRLISTEAKAMAEHVRQGKVRSEEIEGSTFSISNLGMYQVDQFTAIINPPEAAILAVGSAHETPVVENGMVVPGSRMKVTLSVDHRLSDGAEGARYLQALGKLIETPLNLLL
jgi:pyruvate dehydrogenase E2 component (dihydrolipoamide acetyltransferase)